MASFQFDDSRIKDHPDKKLLEDIRTYFKAFTGSDFEGMRDGETEDYTMTDICKNFHIAFPSPLFAPV